MMAATSNIVLTDLSHRPRFGVKGPNAREWLSTLGYATPERPNSWLATADTLHLRLGISEFLIEANTHSSHFETLTKAAKTEITGVYRVPRADAAFQITGSKANDLLSEIAMLDLVSLEADRLFMTQIASISAILIKLPSQIDVSYRLWCDLSYHHYMLKTLTAIALDLGNLDLVTDT